MPSRPLAPLPALPIRRGRALPPIAIVGGDRPQPGPRPAGSAGKLPSFRGGRQPA